MTKGDLAMHKLKGEHEYFPVDNYKPPNGDDMLFERCKVCGHEKRTNQTLEWQKEQSKNYGSYSNFASTYMGNFSSHPTTSYGGGGGGGGGVNAVTASGINIGGAGGAMTFTANPVTIGNGT